ncbi:putative 20S proteasome subunit alpha type 2 [Lasiosphaeria ovina]|uniref:20S proteasome subunit alpha type 2 n=1 Tax=Lasiosphaeria ovina TaxID=92902 RepID=A0AAE0MYE7_9PEZI|nr:putative 20S proteasome subunit alpha type 2 [Lasiosphaeria ovina]
MEYKQQAPTASVTVKPRLIIHGGAGNITPATLLPGAYNQYREALLTIVSKTDTYMRTPRHAKATSNQTFPTALETATFAVTLLEDNALFNSGHGAVFTRDGINELEASVMVTRGFAKRGVGVMGLRRVRNPILLARAILERGDDDLRPPPPPQSMHPKTARQHIQQEARGDAGTDAARGVDVPSAQGHTLLHGETAETLARMYGLAMVEPDYFFTQKRWDEHVRGMERDRGGGGVATTWSRDEYVPQGTCGAVALDADGVLCCATSTGGLTNKLTGRIGDTPMLGAGFWAEEWTEPGDPTKTAGRQLQQGQALTRPGPAVVLSEALRGLVADCLPTPFLYTPVTPRSHLTTTRSVAVSGTGNGDSFLRTAAVRTVGSIARFAGLSSADALTQVTGPSGELQRSAGNRWGRTGEGEGGMIGIESVVVRDAEGTVVETRSNILQDYNCGGMFRAWIDDDGSAFARVWRHDYGVDSNAKSGKPDDPRCWVSEKTT